jgi:hypothetical protein
MARNSEFILTSPLESCLDLYLRNFILSRVVNICDLVNSRLSERCLWKLLCSGTLGRVVWYMMVLPLHKSVSLFYARLNLAPWSLSSIFLSNSDIKLFGVTPQNGSLTSCQSYIISCFSFYSNDCILWLKFSYKLNLSYILFLLLNPAFIFMFKLTVLYKFLFRFHVLI